MQLKETTVDKTQKNERPKFGVVTMKEFWNKINLQGWELIHNYSHYDIGKIWVIFDSLKVEVQYLSRSIEGTWFVQGDFNAVLREEDRCGGSPLDEDHLYELSNCVSAAGLTKIRSVGCQCTWNNNQLGINRIWRRLDRIFANGIVNDNFQRIYSEALPCAISDHSVIITIIESYQRSVSRKFKFFNFWTLHPDFRTILEEEWRINYRGFHIYKLVQKLKAINYRLSTLNRSQFSNISKKTDNHMEILNRLQADLQLDPTNTFLIDEERVMSNHFRFLLKCEERYFKQKSRTNGSTLLEDGRVITSNQDIHKEMTSYYRDMFSKSEMQRKHISSNLRNGTIISDEEGTILMKSITEE
ncbi:uncharacterized protein LOC126670550 [Mercurialis annua]|uniref:uncharacterized protein LOC126670550 n=1 Tax=Mercurialis annua TaxID=3986 RepID=UPI00215F6896|nr:uncharacterized protein LOC126670550 [Mercurialis annua]